MYKDIKDLPPQLDKLPLRAKRIYLKAFNASLDKYGEETARKIAWSAIKRVFQKNKDGNWVEKKSEIKSLVNLSMYITKANLVDGKMAFCATASDTLPDSFEEQMSVELYKSFIESFTGDEYISLAHYPRLDGKGEIGNIESIYVDGDKLKIKGYFADTKLGVATFNAIRKDRRDDAPIDKRVRLSIAFYDKAHKHGTKVWLSQNGFPCIDCAMGRTKGKTYLMGRLAHVAATRCPVNSRATFDYVEEEK